MESKKTRVAGIIIREGKILLIRRVKNGQEYYVFPGGGVEEGESFEEALRREIREELSIDIETPKPIFQPENQFRDRYGGHMIGYPNEHYFFIEKFSGKPELGGPEKKRMDDQNQYFLEWVEWIELLKAAGLKNLFPKEAVAKLRRLPETHPSPEYYKAIPKKRMASGVIIFNNKNELLIVKPSYKDHWSIPGGVIGDNESPRQAAIRETKEEVGIDIKKCRLLSIDYVSNENEKGESLQFIFYGGKLKTAEIDKIKIDNDEIVEYKFVNIKDAMKLFGGPKRNLVSRLSKCLEALKNKTAVYLENGE